MLKEPEYRTRYAARRELAERSTSDVVPAVERWIAELEPEHPDFELYRLEGLWMLQTHNHVDEKLLKEVLNSPDYHARAAAVKVLCSWRDRIEDSLGLVRERVNDEHPRVRLGGSACLQFLR